MELRVLIAYSLSGIHVQTTADYLAAIRDLTSFDVSFAHITHDAELDFDIEDYDVVFVNYCVRACYEGIVAPSFIQAMQRFSGLKVISVQDEYNQTNTLKKAIKDLGFHLVLTCVPQKSLEYVYPRAEFPGVEFVTVLTGYVPDNLASAAQSGTPLSKRPITLGYRGRDIGPFYGQLGYDKYEIGRRMKQICAERGIAADIAVDEASRIYGPGWFTFIGNCRAMLGTESGSNVFDFDGSLEALYKQMVQERGSVSYEEFLPIVARKDSEIDMGQISPRVFECTVMRTPMVLFPGHYSGAIAPGEHYIVLQKDFSNVDEVLTKLDDFAGLEAMADRAYDHLVRSNRFSYRGFARFLRQTITRRHADVVKTDLLNFRITSFLRSGWLSLRRGLKASPFEPPKLTINSKPRLEAATSTPGTREDFARKQQAALGGIYFDETSRLLDIYKNHTEICLNEAKRLRSVYDSERKRRKSGMSAPITLTELESSVTSFHEARRAFLTRIEQLSSHIIRSGRRLDEKSAAELGEISELSQREIKRIEAALNQFNDVYEATKTKANQLLDELLKPE